MEEYLESDDSNILNDCLLLSSDKGKGKEVARRSHSYEPETNFGSNDNGEELLTGADSEINFDLDDSNNESLFGYEPETNFGSDDSNNEHFFYTDKGKGKAVAKKVKKRATNIGSDGLPSPASSSDEEGLENPYLENPPIDIDNPYINYTNSDFDRANSDLERGMRASREHYERELFGITSAGESSNTASLSTHGDVMSAGTSSGVIPGDQGIGGSGSVTTISSRKFTHPPIAEGMGQVRNSEFNADIENIKLSDMDVFEGEENEQLAEALNNPINISNVERYERLSHHRLLLEECSREMENRYEEIGLVIRNFQQQLYYLRRLLNDGSENYFNRLDRIQDIQERLLRAKKLELYFMNQYDHFQEQLVLIDAVISEVQMIIIDSVSIANDSVSIANNFVSVPISLNILDIFSLGQIQIISEMLTGPFFFKLIIGMILIIIKKITTSPATAPSPTDEKKNNLKLEPVKSVFTTFLKIKKKLQNYLLWFYFFIFIAGLIIKIIAFFF